MYIDESDIKTLRLKSKVAYCKVEILNSDYKTLITHTGNSTFAYSKLTKEIESLVVRLSDLEDRLDNSLDAIGSMRDDEVRARQQLEEVKLILKDAKLKPFEKLNNYLLNLKRAYHFEVIAFWKHHHMKGNEDNF